MQLHLNQSASFGQPLESADQRAFGSDVIPEVRRYMAPLGYESTPLHELRALANSLGLNSILVKDESARSPLGSFKALGGAYAVICLVLAEAERHLQRPVDVAELSSPAVQEIARTMTVACATDGNHGRSVAAGARLVGCSCVIFVHAGVSDARVEAMRALGADVRRCSGSYDDSLEEAAETAIRLGWHVVADTSTPGNEAVPLRVMQGYLLMVDEVIEQCSARGIFPTHVFVQAGVGGLAAAVVAHLAQRMNARPRFIVVEPVRAACLYASALADKPVRVDAGEPTFMAMLECYEPSFTAWRILQKLADAFLTIDEAEGLRAMHRLAVPLPGDPFVLSGESGGAGLGGLMAAARDPAARNSLQLDDKSVVLVFNTEGDTDRERYQSLLREASAIGVT